MVNALDAEDVKLSIYLITSEISSLNSLGVLVMHANYLENFVIIICSNKFNLY